MQNELLENLRTCSAVIGYSPIRDEIEYENALSMLHLPLPHFLIPINVENNPVHIANECTEKYGTDLVCVITPGTMFDIYGNRKGRGGGWYDRFFAHVPHSWIRIGVCEKKNFSNEKLDVHAWDIPMHGLLIFDDEVSKWSFLDVANRT